MKKIILIILAVISLIFVYSSAKYETYIIPKEAIRLRIIPNSNNAIDQAIKIKVKTNVQNEINRLLNDINNINIARDIIKSNINTIDNIVLETLKSNKYSSIYKINYGKNYFPNKEYKGVLYKDGLYESVVITLGTGQGDNWWCVMFPPICTIETEKNYSEKIEYKFLISEIFKKYQMEN